MCQWPATPAPRSKSAPPRGPTHFSPRTAHAHAHGPAGPPLWMGAWGPPGTRKALGRRWHGCCRLASTSVQLHPRRRLGVPPEVCHPREVVTFPWQLFPGHTGLSLLESPIQGSLGNCYPGYLPPNNIRHGNIVWSAEVHRGELLWGYKLLFETWCD